MKSTKGKGERRKDRSKERRNCKKKKKKFMPP